MSSQRKQPRKGGEGCPQASTQLRRSPEQRIRRHKYFYMSSLGQNSLFLWFFSWADRFSVVIVLGFQKCFLTWPSWEKCSRSWTQSSRRGSSTLSTSSKIRSVFCSKNLLDQQQRYRYSPSDGQGSGSGPHFIDLRRKWTKWTTGYLYCWLKYPDSVDFYIEWISKCKVLGQSIMEGICTFEFGGVLLPENLCAHLQLIV